MYVFSQLFRHLLWNLVQCLKTLHTSQIRHNTWRKTLGDKHSEINTSLLCLNETPQSKLPNPDTHALLELLFKNSINSLMYFKHTRTHTHTHTHTRTHTHTHTQTHTHTHCYKWP